MVFNGQLIWTKTISNTVGFGITGFIDQQSRLYCSGGKGIRKMDRRLNGDDGTVYGIEHIILLAALMNLMVLE